MKRPRLLPALFVAVVTMPAAAAPKPAPASSLVVISVDGLHPSYVLEADRFGLKIPNLRPAAGRGREGKVLRPGLPRGTHVYSGAAPSTAVAPCVDKSARPKSAGRSRLMGPEAD